MFEQVDLSDAKLAKEFGLGCLVIKGAHLWPLSHFVWDSSPTEVGATFFGDQQSPWDKANLVRIQVYKLPKARNEFAEGLEWFTRDRKKRRIKISDGSLFHEDMLHVKSLPKEWERDGFAISKAQIIQVYQSKKFAVIFRFLAKSGTMLDHPTFKRLVKNVSFDEKQWEKSLPDIIDVTPRSNRGSDSPLTEEGEGEVWQGVGAVMKRLKLAKIPDPKKRMAAIHQEIDAARANKQLDEDQTVNLSIELGCFVGQLFCWDLDWEWCLVREPDGTETEAVCSQNLGMAIDPIEWMYDLITNGKRPINCLLLFNMIEAARLPPSRPNGYTWLS